MNNVNQSIPGAAIAALEQGSKIEAIKIVRIAQNVGLKEAKDIVEAYIDNTPSVKSRMSAANAASAKGALRWVFIIAAIVVIAYYFYTGQK